MKIKSKGILSFMLVIAFALAVPLAACNRGNKFDPETRPLVMSLATPDGVFNPFFGTSGYDIAVTGMTQVSMLTTNEKGEPVCGDNEPVVVKDYKITTAPDKSKTEYEFIIKNGIKFSDGVPLTIKDVLFNLYVYLDPAYTGSSTIYSTKIVGLEQYRMQDDRTDLSDSALSAFEEQFYDNANIRMTDLITYVQMVGKFSPENERPFKDFTEKEIADLRVDYTTAEAAFLKELGDDWNTSANSKESYKDWGFTETWQIFLLNDGQFTDLLAVDKSSGKYIKDENNNYQLDQERSDDYAIELDEYLTGYLEGKEDTAENREKGTKEWAVDMVFGMYFPGTIEETDGRAFQSVLTGWATADAIREKFATESKSEYFKNTVRKVPTIAGIDGTKTTTTDFKGNNLGASHEVLKITIRGVDPKAIWNFAFTVAPMHYYSTDNYNGKNYITSFNQQAGEFGLAFSDDAFMTKVINAPDKVGLPVGAGVYKASNASGSGRVTSDNFMNNSLIYFERNTYFESMGSGISNAKIKYLKFKITQPDQIINSLTSGDIDFGDPSATQDNIKVLNDNGIGHVEIKTSGYGYVGINPRFVPNIVVRRVIMKAMDTSIITRNYYRGGLADLIYRPMTTASWAYPEGVTVFKNTALGLDYSYDSTGYNIEEMIKNDGYVKDGNGIYTKNIPGYGADRLSYKFTIAGGTTDHPAYAMFLKAASILNDIGFDIKVVTSQTAVSDLSTGKLAVWAAAWGSTVDPDMYQVYHKDSLATSVNNWGYKQIKANKTTLYATEWAIIQDLSDLIDDGRSTTVPAERKTIYANALDKVMELAVEFPTYQRKDMSAFNKDRLNIKTMTPDDKRSPYNGLLSRIWELNYN